MLAHPAGIYFLQNRNRNFSLYFFFGFFFLDHLKRFNNCFDGFLVFFGRGDGFLLNVLRRFLVCERDVNRKMVGADVRQSAQIRQMKMV